MKGRDDLRQDAVMQQVFVLVNQLLAKEPATAKRKLSIRTYRVRRRVVWFVCSQHLQYCTVFGTTQITCYMITEAIPEGGPGVCISSAYGC